MKVLKRKSFWVSLVALSLVIATVVSFSATAFLKGSPITPEARTVVAQSGLDLQGLLETEFDEHNLHSDENGFELVAKKSFDMSIFDELDLVGIDEEQETFNVRYEITYMVDDSTILLTVVIEWADELPIFETMPGLLTSNPQGEPDIMFVVDDEYMWLSEMYDSGLFDEVGLFSSIKKAVNSAVNTVVNTVQTAVTTVVTAIVSVVGPAVKVCSQVAVAVLGKELAAKIGATFLMMYQDEQGIYHASFNGWQQYFGYVDLYDAVFNMSTSMDFRKFDFDTTGDGITDYILWAWKADYLNLGAGAELGVYKRWAYGTNIWIVDKNLAMTMTLKLDYKNTTIIDWRPPHKEWWITGFNYKYQNVKYYDLKATYTVTFDSATNSTAMFNAFSSKYRTGYGWTISGTKCTYSF